jgi:predicted methyltransferase
MTRAPALLLSHALALMALAASCSKPGSSGAAATAAARDAAPATAADAATVADPYQKIAESTERTADDRNQDGTRKPAEFLRFAAVKPGMRVADLAAGGGYTTELLQRAVAPNGVVYAQNPEHVRQKFVTKTWPERLARPVNKSVVRVDREMQDPLPPEAKDLDLVVMAFFYHDTVWLKTDRDAMNRKVFDALKPGGVYLVADHSARPGAGATVAESLHRIEEKVVVDEITRAGFKLEGRSTMYENTADARDWNVFGEGRGTTDRFVLRFVKPVAP